MNASRWPSVATMLIESGRSTSCAPFRKYRVSSLVIAKRVCEIRRFSAAPGNVASAPPASLGGVGNSLAGSVCIRDSNRSAAIVDALAAFVLFDPDFRLRQRADDLEQLLRRQRQRPRFRRRCPRTGCATPRRGPSRAGRCRPWSPRSKRSRESESCSSARRCLAGGTILSADRSCGPPVPWAGRPLAAFPPSERGSILKTQEIRKDKEV